MTLIANRLLRPDVAEADWAAFAVPANGDIPVKCEIMASAWPEHLLALLEQLVPVRFVRTRPTRDDPPGIRFSCQATSYGATPARALTLHVPRGATTVAGLTISEARFADVDAVPAPFRARRLATRAPREWRALATSAEDVPLCTIQGQPVWSVSATGGGAEHRSALALPAVGEDTGVADIFAAERWLEMLPLLEFLREATGANRRHLPALRAAFIIDDPNLHAVRYGAVDYAEVARRAMRARHHVAFAAIPLDMWYTSPRAAAIFRTHDAQLSLLVHGNDHARDELAQRRFVDAAPDMLDHARARVERFERKSGLAVSRVIVPPHGACPEAVLAHLPERGFEAACVSTGSLRFHNPDAAWRRLAGYQPVELVGGCPVLPRWSLTGDATRDAVLVAAYLGQAIVLRGHEVDLRGGLDVLDELSTFINGLGEVRWSPIHELARLGAAWSLEGSTCVVHPFALRVRMTVPIAADSIRVADSHRPHAWRVATPDGVVHALAPGEELPLVGAANVELWRDGFGAPPVATARRPMRTPASLMVRRMLTETRDRLRW